MLSNMRGQASNTVQQGKQWMRPSSPTSETSDESYIRKGNTIYTT